MGYSPWGHKESHMTQQLQKTTPTNPSRVISREGCQRCLWLPEWDGA